MIEIIAKESERIKNMGTLELYEYEEKLKYTAPNLKMDLIKLCEARRKEINRDDAMAEPGEINISEFFQ